MRKFGPSLYLDLCAEGLYELVLAGLSSRLDRQRPLSAQWRRHRSGVDVFR